jgi:hypothetical protein
MPSQDVSAEPDVDEIPLGQEMSLMVSTHVNVF